MPWRNSYAEAIILLVCSSLVFAIYQAIPSFPDPDSFYHARLAALWLEHGLRSNFPWLPFTTLNQAFADHHLLYHIVLLPFVSLLGEVIGVKVAQVVLATAFTMSSYAILKRWRVPYAGPALILLYSVYPMLVRVNLVKASALALILFMGLIWAASERRYIVVGILTILYTMAHGGFLLSVVIAVAAWLAQLIVITVRTSRLTWLAPTGVGAAFLAVLLGVVVNPYFPDNLAFLWAQFFQIGVVGYADVIAVGAEWYPFQPFDLIAALSVLLVGATAGAVVIAKYYRQHLNDERVISLGLLVLPLGLLTIRSRRFIEYLVPVLWLLVCLVVLPAWQRGHLQRWWRMALQRLGKWQIVLNVYLLAALLFAIGQPYVAVAKEFYQQASLNRYAAAGEYLRTHVPPGEIIFHGQWDDFPELFYHDPTHRYMVGLDPTFLYLASPEQYQQWIGISSGQDKQATVRHIQEYFGSQYVVVDEREVRTQLLLAYLLRDAGAQTVFQQEHVRIFYLSP